jgi:hypothetical protein
VANAAGSSIASMQIVKESAGHPREREAHTFIMVQVEPGSSILPRKKRRPADGRTENDGYSLDR